LLHKTPLVILTTASWAVLEFGFRQNSTCLPVLFYFGLFVNRVLPVKGTVFLEFQLLLSVAPVLFCGIVTPLAFGALQSHQFYRRLLLTRHLYIPPYQLLL
jgi:hypothetical protein